MKSWSTAMWTINLLELPNHRYTDKYSCESAERCTESSPLDGWTDEWTEALSQGTETIIKASENKNAILVFAFQTTPHFTHFGWIFAVKFFSLVCHPQDVRDEKVSSALVMDFRRIFHQIPWFRWFYGFSVESTESQRNQGFFPCFHQCPSVFPVFFISDVLGVIFKILSRSTPPPNFGSVCQMVQPWERSQTDRQTDTHTDSGDMSPTRTCVPYVPLAPPIFHTYEKYLWI